MALVFVVVEMVVEVLFGTTAQQRYTPPGHTACLVNANSICVFGVIHAHGTTNYTAVHCEVPVYPLLVPPRLTQQGGDVNGPTNDLHIFDVGL